MGQLVHWAYVVGAREHLRAQIKTKLWKDDINLAGHAVDARECSIPKKTTFVLILADLATHSLTDKARAEAKRLDIPIVMGAMSNWTLTRQRLAEFNIVAGSTPNVVQPVIQSAEYRPPKLGDLFKDRVFAEEPVKAADVDPNSTGLIRSPSLASITPPPPEPVIVSSPISEPEPTTTETKEPTVAKNPPRSLAATLEREKIARKILLETKGLVTNNAVSEKCKEATGSGIVDSTLNALRKELKLPSVRRGGARGLRVSPVLPEAPEVINTPVAATGIPVSTDVEKERTAIQELIYNHAKATNLKSGTFTMNADGTGMTFTYTEMVVQTNTTFFKP